MKKVRSVMYIEELLLRIRQRYKETNKTPVCKEMKTVAKECHRKIGSWRKALWLAGIIPDARKKKLPQLQFNGNKECLEMTLDSKMKLRMLQYPGSIFKEKIKS
jgi:hypothetical protein